MRVRLRSVGPPSARFDDVIMDLSAPWDDAAEAWPHPVRSTVIFGENGAGKSTLLQLIWSVLPRSHRPRGGRVAQPVPNRDIGHIALEWRHLRTGDQLITGRVVRSRSDRAIGMSAGWYSFQPSETVGLETLPVDDGDSAEEVSSFRERLHVALQSGAGLTWVRSRQEWEEYLHGCGFNVRWFQWVAGYLSQERTARDWTDEQLISLIVHEAVPSELLRRLELLKEEYAILRDSRELTYAVILDRKRPMVDLLGSLVDSIIDTTLTAMADMQTLSRLPNTIPNVGGREFFRVTYRRKNEGRRVERLADMLDQMVRGAVRRDVISILLGELHETADLVIEVCVPAGSKSDPPQYIPLDEIGGLSGQSMTTLRLLLDLMLGIVVARLTGARGDDFSEEYGPVLLDDNLPLSSRILDGFLEIASALQLQVIYATASANPALLTRFSSVVRIQPQQDPSFGDRFVRATYPTGLASTVADRTGRDEVMDLVPFGEVFDVQRTGMESAQNEGGLQGRDLVRAEELMEWDLHDLTSGALAFSRAPRSVLRQKLLHPGDFVLSRMWIRGPVPIAVVSSDEPPMVASESMLVLRPRSPLRSGEEFFYLEYFRSKSMLGALSDHDAIATVTPKSLNGQLIPRPDGATLTAITELTRAADSFQSWQRDADDAIHGFFQLTDLKKARSYMIEAGRLTRQRREAASLADEVGARLRTTLPYPIARRWREVQAARPDEVGYALVLECAEAAIAYCAVLGMVFADEAQISLQRVRELPRQVRRGMTFTTWFNLLREVSDAATVQDVASDSPLAQFRCFADPDVADTIRSLHERRNQKSHRRGPAAHEMEDAVIEIRGQLEDVLSRIEWLVDYALRRIDICRWDSFTNTSQITYRELMGDHNIVSPAEEHVSTMLETGSAYITDSFGHYRLLRPFLLAQACPQCGQLTVFVIDQWNATNQEADYLALDHTHKITVTGVQSTLRQVGLL